MFWASMLSRDEAAQCQCSSLFRTCDPKDNDSDCRVHESMLELFEHVLHSDHLLLPR